MEKVLEAILLVIAITAFFGAISLFIVQLVQKGYRNISWKTPLILMLVYIMTYALFIVLHHH